MEVKQFVMAYKAEQDRLRAILPEEFSSLRPVLRINAEIRGDTIAYIEFNTAVQSGDVRGWLNIGNWDSKKDNLSFIRDGNKTTFTLPFLKISFTAVGIKGNCPAEKDNDGCFFPEKTPSFQPAERIIENKEFCDCEFEWKFSKSDAHGVSTGKTLPAFYEDAKNKYEKQSLCVENAAAIPCESVLGAYVVTFER